ncbi:MAG TPA: ArsR family transcriptional regulator [Gemmatimonadales bacterium]|nr:ArsR family transcriptional regulator [Gemmatimonadales bacterium]
MRAPGLGESQSAILEVLKRQGRATVPELAGELELNIETIRDHLKALAGLGLVHREGNRKSGPGRPEGLYALTPAAESLFPRMEGAVLRELAAYLVQSGNEAALKGFFDQRIGQRREEVLARVRRLKGRKRLNEVARILTELGFMAVVEQEAGECRLRLCHCPIRDLVDATRIPCLAETGFLTELLGERPTRVSYIPSGASSCTYRMGA